MKKIREEVINRQATLAWNLIFQVVKENCTKDFSGATPNDEMEMLLRSRS